MAAASSSSQLLRRLGRTLSIPAYAPAALVPDFEGLLIHGRIRPDVASSVLRAAMCRNRARTVVLIRALGMREEVIEATAAAISDPNYGRFGLLHLAALVGDADYVHLLVTVWELKTNEAIGGYTPLMIAVQRGFAPIAEVLCTARADVSYPCTNGETPLSLAAKNGDAKMVKLLLPFIDSKNFLTPLAIAAEKGLYDCIKCLLDDREDPNVSAENGERPIEIAARLGFRNCVEVLYPVTTLTYQNVEDIIKQLISVNSEVEAGRAQVDHKKSEDNAYQEKQRKGTVGIFFAIMDKIPTTLFGISGMGFAYLTGEQRQAFMKNYWFQIMCGGCVLFFCTSIVLYGSTAYYKEMESVDDPGFIFCSYSVLAMVLQVVFVLSMVLTSFEGAELSIVLVTAVIALLIIILSWPVIQNESKSVARCLFEMIKKRWSRNARAV